MDPNVSEAADAPVGTDPVGTDSMVAELAAAEAELRAAEDLASGGGGAGGEVARQRARCRLGLARCAAGQLADGLPMIEDATKYLISEGPVEDRAAVLLALAEAYGLAGRFTDAVATLDRAGEWVPDSDDPLIAGKVALDRAGHLASTGDASAARVAAEEAERLCREAGFAAGQAQALWLTGVCAEHLGDEQAAILAYDKAVPLAEDEMLNRQIRFKRGGLLAGTSRSFEVIDDLIEAVDSSTQSGEWDAVRLARERLVLAHLNAAQSQAAAEVAEGLIRDLEAADADPDTVDQVRHLLATAYRRMDRYDEATALMDMIETRVREAGNLATAGAIAEQTGEFLDQADRDASAAEWYARAADSYRQEGMTAEEARTRRLCASSLMWAGALNDAMAALDAADRIAAALPKEDPEAEWERAVLGYEGAKIVAKHAAPAGPAGPDTGAAVDRPAVDRAAIGRAADRARLAGERFLALAAVQAAAQADALSAELLLAAGRPDEAEQVARLALGFVSGGGNRRWIESLLVSALEELGRSDEAAELRKAAAAEDGAPSQDDNAPRDGQDGEASRDSE